MDNSSNVNIKYSFQTLVPCDPPLQSTSSSKILILASGEFEEFCVLRHQKRSTCSTPQNTTTYIFVSSSGEWMSYFYSSFHCVLSVSAHVFPSFSTRLKERKKAQFRFGNLKRSIFSLCSTFM